MSGPVFVALVNPKSGGNVGNQLVARFKEILDDDRVYNLSEEGGPKRALHEHCQTENLRIIGKNSQTINRGPPTTSVFCFSVRRRWDGRLDLICDGCHAVPLE